MRAFDRETNDARLLKKAEAFAAGIIRFASDILFSPSGGLVSTDVQAAITELDTKKAPLASPALTGTPTAPTANPGTNTTQIATAAFVQAAIAALVASAPGTLDTLNELATALGDDPNFATTMTNALAAKAPLTSPALTGTPTAPTAGSGTNTTQIATTAFVQAALAALVAAAPTALDTLNELAVALGNDPNFATTITNALAGKAAIAQEAWSAPSFQNSWGNYDAANWCNAGYMKDTVGFVHLRGLISGGTANNIFVLPADYRPPKRMRFVVSVSGGFGELDILADGTVTKAAGGANTYLSLEGITFRP